jgi:hypothetical protein
MACRLASGTPTLLLYIRTVAVAVFAMICPSFLYPLYIVNLPRHIGCFGEAKWF